MSQKKGLSLCSKTILVGLMIGSVFFGAVSARAADGSGTNSVSPTSAGYASAGNTFTFTFTAAEAMNSGGISIEVPSGWSAPQGTAGVAGYTTANSTAGTIGSVINTADVLTGWIEDDGDVCASLTLDTTLKYEGTGSIKCTNTTADPDATDSFQYRYGSNQNWSAYTKIGLWLYSTVAMDATNYIQVGYIGTASDLGDGTALELFNIQTLPANTWTYYTFDLTAARSAVRGIGIVCRGNGCDTRNINVDYLLIGPGSPTFSGSGPWIINVPFVAMATSSTSTVVYGSGGGASGVTTPAVVGVHTFTTKSESSANGTLTNIASHPTVTIGNAVPILSSIAPTSTEVNSGTTTITLTGSNFIASSTARWNGSDRATTFLGSTQLQVTIPPSDLTTAGTSTVTVFNPAPGGGTSSGQSFVVRNRVPTVVSLSPNEAFIGDATTTVTITGTNFVSGATANWNGSPRSTTFVNSTTLNMTVTTVDLANAGTSTVTVTNPTPGGGTSTTSASFVVKYRTPTITTNTPDPVYVNETLILTITGTNFYTNSVVKFAGTTLSSTTTGSTSIAATLPASVATSTGAFALTVTNSTPGGGVAATTTNVHYRSPTLTTIVPSTAIAGAAGATSTVTGTGFAPATVIRWNGSPRTTMYASSTQVSVFFTTSDFSNATTSTITAFNPTPGGGTSNELTFTVLNPSPTTVGISPTSTFVGDATTTITITGTGFNTQSIARYNGENRTTSFINSTTLEMTLSPSDSAVTTSTALVTVFNPTPGGGTSNAQAFAVNKRNITITVGSSLNPSTYGDMVIFTATTTSGFGTPTGTVTFKNGGVAFATSTLSGGVATVATSTLAIGTHSITATYNGDATYNASTSATVLQTVNKANITITLGSSLNPSTYGSAVTFAATTTATFGTPSGTVTFKNGGIAFATSTLSNGIAIAATNTLNAGTHIITATYNSDARYNASTSAGLSQVVNNPVPVITLLSPDNTEEGSATTSLTISGNSFVPGVSVTFNNAPLSIDSSSSSSINTSIPASLLTTFGTSTVAVTNPAPGGGTATSSFIITRSAVRFVIIDPTDGTVDAPITVTVVAQKENGATSTNYQSDVMLNASGSATPTSQLINIINGIGTTTISDTVAETVTLSLTDSQSTGLDASSTQQVVFAHGVAAKFALTGPATLNVGDRAAFTATRKDQFNNLVTTGTDTTAYFYTSSTSTSAKFYNAATGGSVVTSALISSGTSMATVWYYDEDPRAHMLTASDNSTAPDGNVGIDDATSTITVNAVATKFVIVDPTDGTVDAPITITVQAQDNLNRIVANYQNDVTLVASSTSGQATTTGLVNIINGVGTINVSDTVAETVHLSLVDSQSTGLNTASSTQDVVFAPGATTQFSLTHSGNMEQNSRKEFIAGRKDQYGNFVSASTTPVYLYASPTSTTKFYNAAAGGSEITSITLTPGNATTSFWLYSNTSATTTVTVSDNTTTPDGDTGINDTSNEILVTPIAVRFEIVDPTDGTVDAAIGVMVRALDEFGQVVSSFNQDITLAVTGSAVANPALVDIINGVGTTQVTDTVAETVSLSLTDTQTTGLGATSTQQVVFGVGAFAKLNMNNVTSATAGTLVPYTVTRTDQYNNQITSGTHSIGLSASPTSTPGRFYSGNSTTSAEVTSISITPGNAVVQFWYYNEVAGSYQVTTQSGSVIGYDDIVIDPAAIAKFTINDRTSMNPASRVQYTVTRKDQFNNLVTVGDSVAYLYASPTGSSTAFYNAATAGSLITSITIGTGQSAQSAWYYEEGAGTHTITASDNASAPDGSAGILDAFDTISVQVATGTRFVFNPAPTPATLSAGTASVVTIQAQDDYGNIDTNYQNDVMLVTGVNSAFGTGLVSGQVLIDIVNGEGKITLTDNIAETVDLALSDSQGTGLNVLAVASITWNPGAASQFVLTDQTSMVAGSSTPYVVTRKDQYGNVVKSGSNIVYLYSNSTGGLKRFQSSQTSTSSIAFVTLSGSMASTTFWYYDESAGTWDITVSDNATTPDGATGIADASDSLIVTPAPVVADRYVIKDPADAGLNENTVVIIQAQDASGAVDTTVQEDVYLVFSTSSIQSSPMKVNDRVLVNIVDGVGTVTVSNGVAETVQLSLERRAGSTSTLTITSTQDVMFFVRQQVAGGGGGVYVPPTVSFTGRAYPGAKVSLFARIGGQDIPLERNIEVKADGTFTIDFTGALKGLESFGLAIYDKDGKIAQIKTYGMDKVTQVTAAKNLYIAPTTGLIQRTVTIGNNVGVTGSAAPGSVIKAEVDGKPVDAEVTVGRDGTYRLLINTRELSYGGHVVRTKQVDKNGVESDYSPLKVFMVSRALVTRADLNNNGGIDIGDWSIFLTRFGSTDTETRRQVDLNDDGKVDISDFSIFIRSTVNR